jgi:glucose/arabinose dehydrogenase
VINPFVQAPVGFSFLPDGRILIIEKDSGNVRLARAGTTTSIVIATIPGLTFFGERGLLGIAVDPAWPARPYVYFFGTYTGGNSRVTMYTASGDLSNPTSSQLSLGSPYVLLGDIPDLREHHNAGTLRFGPDAALYVSTGDDGGQCEAQDVNFFNGKILRLDVSRMPGPGSGPPSKADITPAGNPYSGPTDNARLVYASGLRNPFRFTVDSATGNLYIGDVGDLAWEEIDEAVRAGYTGDNYGWPGYEGLVPSMCCPGCTLLPPLTAPIHVYENPADPQSAAVTGGPVYRRVLGSPRSFGFEYDGSLFLSDHYGGWIRRLSHATGSWDFAPPVPGQPDALNWAAGIGFLSDLQVGPDGALYFTTMVNTPGGLLRGLHRIVPAQAVDAAFDPLLHLESFPNPTAAGLTVRYRMARPAEVWMSIYDPAGRLVRTLGPVFGRTTEMYWDGRTERGTRVAPGSYFYRLSSAGRPLARGKITLAPGP